MKVVIILIVLSLCAYCAYADRHPVTATDVRIDALEARVVELEKNSIKFKFPLFNGYSKNYLLNVPCNLENK